jgi:6-phosphofructo-2-kinase / fructose-2,6-biphosphatase 4
MVVGLPARGKTHLSVSLSRYLKWLGVKVRVFHLGDYRRKVLGARTVPEDYFSPGAVDETRSLRTEVLDTCRADLLDFFDKENGQVGIYDAVNPTSQTRREWKETFDKHDIQTIFIESLCDNQEIIEQNVRSVKISSPDVRPLVLLTQYVGWKPDDAVKDYIARINAKIPHYEPVSEKDFTYIKLININQRMEVRNATGYLASRIVFYLMNLHTQRRTLYFARVGQSVNITFKSDDGLSPEGQKYAKDLAAQTIAYREVEHAQEREQGEKPRSLTVRPLLTLLISGMDLDPSANTTNSRCFPK